MRWIRASKPENMCDALRRTPECYLTVSPCRRGQTDSHEALDLPTLSLADGPRKTRWQESGHRVDGTTRVPHVGRPQLVGDVTFSREGQSQRRAHTPE